MTPCLSWFVTSVTIIRDVRTCMNVLFRIRIVQLFPVFKCMRSCFNIDSIKLCEKYRICLAISTWTSMLWLQMYYIHCHCVYRFRSFLWLRRCVHSGTRDPNCFSVSRAGQANAKTNLEKLTSMPADNELVRPLVFGESEKTVFYLFESLITRCFFGNNSCKLEN